MTALIGLKKNMTQIFKEDGTVVPCTIIDVSGVVVADKRSKDTDGYDAIVLGMGKKERPNKAELGKWKKLGFVPQYVSEVRVKEGEDLSGYEIKKPIPLSLFEVGDTVKVIGRSKGKGFQGVVKRWGFKGGPRTHGQSDRERAPGSIGGGTDPGRVFKGKKMPGRMGGARRTILNLKIAKVDAEKNIVCVRGAVPGSTNSVLKIVKN